MHMIQFARRWMFAVLTAGTLASIAMPTTARAQVGHMYRLNSGLCPRLVTFGGFPVDGTLLEQVPCTPDDPFQQWYLVYNGHGPIAGHSGNYYLYWIVNAATGKCADVRDGLNADGSVIQAWTCNDNRQQLWAVGAANGGPFPNTGWYEVIGARSGKCFTIPFNSEFIGMNPVISTCTSRGIGSLNRYQLWLLPGYY